MSKKHYQLNSNSDNDYLLSNKSITPQPSFPGSPRQDDLQYNQGQQNKFFISEKRETEQYTQNIQYSQTPMNLTTQSKDQTQKTQIVINQCENTSSMEGPSIQNKNENHQSLISQDFSEYNLNSDQRFLNRVKLQSSKLGSPLKKDKSGLSPSIALNHGFHYPDNAIHPSHMHHKKKSFQVIGKIKKHQNQPQREDRQLGGLNEVDEMNQSKNRSDNLQENHPVKGRKKIEYKQWHFIQILGKVKIFMKKMILTRPGQSFYKMTKTHIEMINDLSYYFQDAKHKSYIFGDEFQNMIKYKFIITPQTKWITPWKIVIFFQVMIQMFILPLKSSFDFNFTDDILLVIFYVLPITCLVIDMFLSFNTSYFSEGVQVTNRFMIISEYMKIKFWIDLITISSLLLQLQQDNIVYVFIYMLKLLTVMEIYHDIDEEYELQYRFPTVTTIFQLIYMLLMFAHYSGSMFHLIADKYEGEDSWLYVYNLKNDSKLDKYITSLYFSFITMSTVGYGDISPQTLTEKVYILIITLISCFVFSYTVNTIGALFQERAYKIAQLKQQTYDVANYMKNRGISRDVQNAVRKYLHYIQNNSTSKTQQGQEILKVISKKLRECVYLEFYGSIIKETKMFSLNFSQEFMNQIALVMKEQVKGPGENLFYKDDRDFRVYFIKSGEIEIYLDKYSQTGIQQEDDIYQYDVRKAGEIVGDQAFFAQIQREYNARSTKASHLAYIEYDDIQAILKQFPEDFEKFCEIREKILVEKKAYSERCPCCNYQYFHSIITCPYLHFSRNKHFLIQKFNSSFNHEKREKYSRNDLRMIKSLGQNTVVRDHLRQLRRDVVFEDESEDDDRENLEKNDKQFFLQTPKISCNNGCFYVVSDAESDLISEEEDEPYPQKPLFQQDKYHNQQYQYTADSNKLQDIDVLNEDSNEDSMDSDGTATEHITPGSLATTKKKGSIPQSLNGSFNQLKISQQQQPRLSNAQIKKEFSQEESSLLNINNKYDLNIQQEKSQSGSQQKIPSMLFQRDDDEFLIFSSENIEDRDPNQLYQIEEEQPSPLLFGNEELNCLDVYHNNNLNKSITNVPKKKKKIQSIYHNQLSNSTNNPNSGGVGFSFKDEYSKTLGSNPSEIGKRTSKRQNSRKSRSMKPVKGTILINSENTNNYKDIIHPLTPQQHQLKEKSSIVLLNVDNISANASLVQNFVPRSSKRYPQQYFESKKKPNKIHPNFDESLTSTRRVSQTEQIVYKLMNYQGGLPNFQRPSQNQQDFKEQKLQQSQFGQYMGQIHPNLLNQPINPNNQNNISNNVNSPNGNAAPNENENKQNNNGHYSYDPKDERDWMFLYWFDVFKIYAKYFTNNNMPVVINQFEKLQVQLQSKNPQKKKLKNVVKRQILQSKGGKLQKMGESKQTKNLITRKSRASKLLQI